MGDPVSFRKGTIVSYDQATGANVVEVGGTNVSNLPIFGVAEAATYAAGSSVGIFVVDSGGSQSWFIAGRIVRPSTDDYTDAVNRLSNSILSASVATGEETTNTGYVDLTTYGPVVYPTVRSSGRLLVFISASILAVDDASPVRGGSMGIELADSTGAVITGPASLPVLVTEYQDDASHIIGDIAGATRAVLLEGLSAGSYRIAAKYKAGASGNHANFSGRNITTIAL